MIFLIILHSIHEINMGEFENLFEINIYSFYVVFLTETKIRFKSSWKIINFLKIFIVYIRGRVVSLERVRNH